MTSAVAAPAFGALLAARADDQQTGLVFDGAAWTWAEVVAECRARVALLEEVCGSAAGVHVGVLLDNVPDFVFWLGAASLSGAVVVGLNTTRRGEALAHDVRHADCAMVVTEQRHLPLLAGLDLGPAGDRVLDVDSPDYRTALASARASRTGVVPLPAPDATLLLLFSSGSTGVPKAVICSQGRLGSLAVALGERMEIGRESVTYLCMPLFHGNAIMTNLAPAAHAGARVVMARRFSASRWLRDVTDHGVTYWNYVGRALAYVLATDPTPQDAHTSLRLAYGTEASAADADRFARRFGCRVMEGYGASEGVLRINLVPGTPPGSLGRPVGDRVVDIVDEETGRVCEPAVFGSGGALLNPDQAIGQMVVRDGGSAFEGYYANPAAMADRVRDGDFWTGDLAYRTADGYFFFAGRTDDWLRVDSENVAVAPIERVLHRHPDVSLAIVYGVPDPRTGDQIMVTVELRPGRSFDPDGWLRFLDAQPDLGTKWAPRFVRVTAELPNTGNGKVARSVLRKEGWHCADPVWVRKAGGYVPLDAAGRERLTNEFAEHGRTERLVSPS